MSNLMFVIKITPPKNSKTKKLLVKMIYTALAVGSALWGGQRLMVDQVRAQFTGTPHMEEALKKLETDEAQRARVKAYLQKKTHKNGAVREYIKSLQDLTNVKLARLVVV